MHIQKYRKSLTSALVHRTHSEREKALASKKWASCQTADKGTQFIRTSIEFISKLPLEEKILNLNIIRIIFFVFNFC